MKQYKEGYLSSPVPANLEYAQSQVGNNEGCGNNLEYPQISVYIGDTK